MISWLYPAALAGLLAVAGPVIVHLLRRAHARQVIVPTVRFFPATRESAVRMKAPSDVGLLLVRMAIVASAALALARPLWLTDARRDAWDARIARVIVVDETQPLATDTVDGILRAETEGARHRLVVHATDVASALQRAADWLAHAPPARREIVVISSFAHGALSAADVADVPQSFGLRFVSVDPQPSGGTPRVSLLTEEGRAEGAVRVEGERTGLSVNVSPEGLTHGSGALEGLRILAPAGQSNAVARVLTVVSSVGTFAPSAEQPIVISFRGVPSSPTTTPVAAWSVGAARRFLATSAIEGVPVRVHPSDALMIHADVEVNSVEAARVVKAALDARMDVDALRAAEVVRIPRQQLALWSREPGPADPSAWQQSDESDARWLWGAALALLLIETVMRRTARVAEVSEARAA